jgi:hypothetical protein
MAIWLERKEREIRWQFGSQPFGWKKKGAQRENRDTASFRLVPSAPKSKEIF